MPKGDDGGARAVAAFLTGALLVALVFAIFGPKTDSIREEVREEVHAEYMAERTIRENEIALENLVWSLKRIDGEIDDLWDRLEVADLLDEKRLSLQKDLND